MTHTPGPWTARTANLTGGEDITIEARTPIHNNPVFIARAYNSGILGTSDPEREANARLIAAAPAMLDALREIRREYSNVRGESIDAILEFAEEMYPLVDAAIAAAEPAVLLLLVGR